MNLYNHNQNSYAEQYGLTATVHLDRLHENIRIVQENIPDSYDIICVIKADAYGHGALRLAREFSKKGIKHFAVSDLAEALVLRENNITSPILVLSHIPQEYVRDVVANDLTASVSSLSFAQALAQEAQRQNKHVEVHVKVDTGMGRFGVTGREVLRFIRKLYELSCLTVTGIYSHLSSTFTDDIASNDYTEFQLSNFNGILDELRHNDLLPECIHVGTSTSLIGFPDKVLGGYFNAIRIGTLFLGFEERPGSTWEEHPTPICDIHTRLLTVKHVPEGSYISYDRRFLAPTDLKTGVLGIGYAHGLHRDLCNCGQVMISGEACTVIGKISLGNTIIDITQIASVPRGSKVLVFGKENSAYTQGKKIGRGTWEILLPLLQHCSTIEYIE